jgi:hypothetical protein
MEIEPTIPPSVIFSDGVIREERTGKLTLVGTFHHFNPPGFPFRPPPFFITVSLSNFRGKLDRFKIAIRVEDKSSGYVVFSAAGEISTSNVLSPSDTVQIPFQVTAEFPRTGLYAVVVLEGSEQIGSRDLMVNEPKTAA